MAVSEVPLAQRDSPVRQVPGVLLEPEVPLAQPAPVVWLAPRRSARRQARLAPGAHPPSVELAGRLASAALRVQPESAERVAQAAQAARPEQLESPVSVVPAQAAVQPEPKVPAVPGVLVVPLAQAEPAVLLEQVARQEWELSARQREPLALQVPGELLE